MSIFNPASWGWLRKATISIVESLKRPDHGAIADAGYPEAPLYPAMNGMSAYSRFAYLFAASNRRAADLASIPLRLYVGHPKRDADAYVLTDHPFYDLMEQPNSDETEVEFRRQLMVDLQLTGTWFGGIVAPTPTAEPVSLIRWHPEDVTIIPNRHGPAIGAFTVNLDGSEVNYSPEAVCYIRAPSWDRGTQGLYGQGVVRPLHDELTTQLASREHQRKLASQGRPDVVLSPVEKGDQWDEKARKLVLAAWKKMIGKGGPLVMSGAMKAEFLNLLPKDMEYQELNKYVIGAIRAATQTPPIILGQEVANYATANKQDGLYWRGLVHAAALVDARLTLDVARRYPKIRGRKLYVRHDFSGVLALQAERTAQYGRASTLIDQGADRASAYAFEGIAGVPLPDTPLEQAEAAVEPDKPEPDKPEPEPVDGDEEDREDKGYVRAVRQEPQRRSAWQAWLIKAHKPAEQRIKASVRRYLKAASARYASRLSTALAASGGQLALIGDSPGPTSTIAVSIIRGPSLEDVLDNVVEEGAMRKAVEQAWKRTWTLAATAAARELPVDGLTFDADGRREIVRSLDGLVKNAVRTQTDAIHAVIERGLASGASVGEMQTAIRRAAVFGPARSLRIARTEATRAVNLGTFSAYQDAEARGVVLQKVWLTASGAVRPSHEAMDGQERALSALFRSGDGNDAPHPGGFDLAAEDINCRCALSNKVLQAPIIGG